MIRKKGARLNGRKARGNDRLAPGDRLSIDLEARDADGLEGLLREEAAARREGESPLPLLYRDEHVLAFDKPPGMAAHPGSGHTLTETVLGALYAATGSSGRGRHRPALVGRLDRDTSGVQLAGVSARGVRELERMSREGEISKTYLALVRDRKLPASGRIDLPLSDHRSGRRRMRVVRSPGRDGAVEAVTAYRVVARSRGCALVEVRPETGRQHQIRAHFAHIGAPLAGDARYGDRAFDASLTDHAAVERLCLHCEHVALTHPVSRRSMRIASDLPRDFTWILDSLHLRLARARRKG
jgi:23S rRNA pseudouridine955/2504/2580 synthase